MGYADDFENAVLRIMDRATAGRHNKRNGLVTSWDQNRHLAKVMFQPEGHETGWLPVHTMSAGDGYGHMTGLTAGDGMTTGDQVEVTYQEGDFETGAITARIHSETDAAPTVQSGEQLFQSPFSSSVKLANDGSITSTDKGGSVIKQDGSGNVAISNAQALTVDLQNTSHINVPTNKIFYLGGDGVTGTYDFVVTASGPSINVKARIS